MNARKRTDRPFTILIFGASGDLTRRKLVPSLYSLDREGLLEGCLRIVGIGRTPLSDEAFKSQLKEGVAEFGGKDPEDWRDFSGKIEYQEGGYDDPQTYERIKARYEGNILFYMAVPAQIMPAIVRSIGEAGLNQSEGGWRRVVVEKPFGTDLDSAKALNADLHAVFAEENLFRIDHYLGKETVQNIMTFRFANAIFEPLWNRKYIDHILINVHEKEGIGHRGEYYDQMGILRDMFQNHLMQLLSLTAMEPPVVWGADTVRDEKVKVLRAVQPIERSTRGQYRGYREENDVAPDSNTATFALLELHVNNWRWQGIPFYLCSGKKLKTKSAEIIVRFKRVPYFMFPLEEGERIEANMLTLMIQPEEGILLQFDAKRPGADFITRPVRMTFHYADDFGDDDLLDAYERLILEAIRGDASLFTRADEIELAWKLIDPVLRRWQEEDTVPLNIYEPGTWGPAQAQEIISGFKRKSNQI